MKIELFPIEQLNGSDRSSDLIVYLEQTEKKSELDSTLLDRSLWVSRTQHLTHSLFSPLLMSQPADHGPGIGWTCEQAGKLGLGSLIINYLYICGLKWSFISVYPDASGDYNKIFGLSRSQVDFSSTFLNAPQVVIASSFESSLYLTRHGYWSCTTNCKVGTLEASRLRGIMNWDRERG